MKKVFLTYNNTQLNNLLVQQRLKDITDFYHFPVAGWVFDATDNLDPKLTELADQGVEFVVVSALGNFLRLHSIDDAVINDCLNNNAPLAGHLLDRKNYYCIDPQFFCLNLKTWDQVGRPKFQSSPKRSTFTSVGVIRSEENVHDDYTPLWIKPGQEQEYTLDFLDFGTQVLYKFLEHGHQLININQDIRARKHYLYPDYNEQKLVDLFTNWTRPEKEIPLQHFYDNIQYHFDNYDRTVYVLNSEDVISTSPIKIDHYSGVCGGLKAVGILNNQGFHENTCVSLFDISQPAVDYQQYLVNEWDGDFDNYLTVFEKFKKQHPSLQYAWRSWNTWEVEIERFLKSACLDKKTFRQTWQQYQTLPINFTCINLLDVDQVTEYFSSFNTGKPRDYYIWVSNSFYMEHTIARYGTAWLKEKSNTFKSVLRRLPGRVRVEDESGLNRVK